MIRNFNRWLILAIIITLVSGTALTMWTVQREDSLLRTDLLIKTRHLSGDISRENLKGLTGSESDLGTPGYNALKNQMTQIQSVDPKIRFIYLMGQRPDGTVFFYVDSESPDSEAYFPPGQVYI